MTVISFREASNSELELLNQMLFSGQPSKCSSSNDELLSYDIQYVQKSESAWVLFVQPKIGRGKLAVKILCNYRDIRYDLRSIKQRQDCQIEALKWNRTFSHNIYYGLARVHSLNIDEKQLVLGHIVEHSTAENLCSGADYAQVMRQLPANGRLDTLISTSDEDSLRQDMLRLVQHVIQIHKRAEPLLYEEATHWGSCEQLRRKLEHNIALADPIFAYDESGCQRHLEAFRSTFTSMKDRFAHAFTWEHYHAYFKQRVNDRHIARCHGDLKAPNIWIEASPTQADEGVSILDSIDFNPMYYNIDTLSDFATLVVDIQTRTGNVELANDIVEVYLTDTHQTDTASRSILQYYLFEKAYVGAAISIVYDDAPQLGEAYLQVAQERLNELLLKVLMIA